ARADMDLYSRDETEDLQFFPEVVVKPDSAAQIALLLKLCNENHIPATARGGGTGLAGAALPIYGGLLISLERLNQIIDIDERNFQATLEPGVITQVFIYAV